ncbi:LuxR C-terminal-related transcriptional regulator [Yersinia pestis]|uniref:LuxR family protein n=1 Tax=Yersinia pestis Java 9 TaxID=880632 RepID=E8PS63_YERPE|nr:LuxR C-terminal-related transcriptional regulator [Yersinia pestis]ADW66863.1 LuxR family protein [Yersinia pestis Java 9]AJJ37944.1 bacterial regulatory s, luxR family protein [Yersinia pestis]MDL1703529.1 LuxR C-terminal-related transcriptional regulator [Yersinia pestis]MDL1707494.1 LuxR C-terminal-related transcriptional regulator [Yersinia pestis]MDL1723465.1 LuxR C-terminal-related transcriptional regulator [Yersinia pestis]
MTKVDAICICRLHQIFEEDQLSDHQKDIAILYAIGNTIAEIADKKGIKPITVRNHLDVVRRSLGDVTLSGLRTVVFLRVLSIVVNRV